MFEPLINVMVAPQRRCQMPAARTDVFEEWRREPAAPVWRSVCSCDSARGRARSPGHADPERSAIRACPAVPLNGAPFCLSSVVKTIVSKPRRRRLAHCSIPSAEQMHNNAAKPQFLPIRTSGPLVPFNFQHQNRRCGGYGKGSKFGQVSREVSPFSSSPNVNRQDPFDELT